MMLKRCCCLSLFYGSLLIVVARLIHWILILLATIYVAVQIYSPDNGLVPYHAKLDIERNSHVLLLMILVSLVGIGVESFLLQGVVNRKLRYMGYWYTITLTAFLLSIALALNFILGILEIPSEPHTGRNFVFDAFCVMFHVVFFFIPEYLFGPRLTPVLITVMILVHICLPVFHLYSFIMVRSFQKEQRYNDYLAAIGEGRNGIEETAPAMPKKCQNLCQKCQLAAMEANGGCRGVEANGAKPIETTC